MTSEEMKEVINKGTLMIERFGMEVVRLRSALTQIYACVLYPDMTQAQMAAVMYKINKIAEEALK